MTTKICSTCKKEKQLSDFYKNKTRPDGYQYSCKGCMNAQNDTSRKTNIVKYRATRNARHAKNTERIRAWKSERGCVNCGEDYARCLELHHLDPTEKEFDPSEGYQLSWTRFLEEAAKCVVLCSNCHRKVHGGVLQI